MLGHADRGYTERQTGLLTVQEVAERLAVSLATVRRLTRAGALTRVVIGGSVRFEPVDVEALIERGKQGAVPDGTGLTAADGTQRNGTPGVTGRRTNSVWRDRHDED
jgi:excisionase family DNA binding protein